MQRSPPEHPPASDAQCGASVTSSNRVAVMTPTSPSALITATSGERLRAIMAATSTMVSSAFTVDMSGSGLGSTCATVLPPSLSATRSAIDSLSTPASDGSSWTYGGTSRRTTCEAGNIVTGIPAVSVTTSPGNRRVASNRTASSALEFNVTTGNSSAIFSARTHQRYDGPRAIGTNQYGSLAAPNCTEPRLQRHVATPAAVLKSSPAVRLPTRLPGAPHVKMP